MKFGFADMQSARKLRTFVCAARACVIVAILLAFFSATFANAESFCPINGMNAERCARRCAGNSRGQSGVALQTASTGFISTQQMGQGHNMGGMNMTMSTAAKQLMQEVSGTSVDPASAPMAMRMKMLMRSGWNLGFMGNAFLTETQQTGPRGADKLYSTNMAMFSAEHAIGRGAFVAEAMFSLEPATVSERQYPLLFQTGETAFGAPIEDGQHPHNFFMGLGMHYARPLGDNTIFEAYFAPVGDPALGPLAYPHRASAAEIPEAPIGHHWEDSTHISYDVVTVGLKHNFVRLEASGFHGAEPGEDRWEISGGAIDSWSGRLLLMPTANWVAQVSVGRLAHPEALERGDVVRTTGSVEYSRPMGASNWSTSFVFGRNHKTATAADTNALLLESVVPFRGENFFTGRWELVDKDELFAAQPGVEQQLLNTAGTDTFRIGAYTVGYTRYFQVFSPVRTGFGANFTTYTLPDAIVPFYGEHPFGVNVYLHLQLKPSGK